MKYDVFSGSKIYKWKRDLKKFTKEPQETFFFVRGMSFSACCCIGVIVIVVSVGGVVVTEGSVGVPDGFSQATATVVPFVLYLQFAGSEGNGMIIDGITGIVIPLGRGIFDGNGLLQTRRVPS